MLPSSMRHMPSGLLRSEAIFASSLFGAIPTEAVKPVCCAMRRLISVPMRKASPHNCRLAVTSRNASSSDRPSTNGVNSRKIANTCAEIS